MRKNEEEFPGDVSTGTFLVAEDRMLLQRLVYYQVLQTDTWFVGQVRLAFQQATRLGSKKRTSLFAELITPLNLPKAHACRDLDAAFAWMNRPGDHPSDEVDLISPHRVFQPLRGLTKTRTLHFRKAISFDYNPIWEFRSDAMVRLTEDVLKTLRREVLDAMRAVEKSAGDKGISAMPRKSSPQQLRRHALHVYQRSSLNMQWKDIAGRPTESHRVGANVAVGPANGPPVLQGSSAGGTQARTIALRSRTQDQTRQAVSTAGSWSAPDRDGLSDQWKRPLR